MKRELLKELGLTDEQIERVMESHGESVNAVRTELDTTKNALMAKETETQSLESQIADRDKQLETLSGQTGQNDELQKTIDALKLANKEQKEAYQKEKASLKLNFGIEKALTTAGAKNQRAVMALIDKDIVKLNDDGTGIVGLEEQIKSIKESDGYLFETSVNQNTESNQPSTNNNDYSGSSQKGNSGKDPSPEEVGKEFAHKFFGNQTGGNQA